MVSFLNCSAGLGRIKLPTPHTTTYRADEIVILVLVFTLWVAILTLFFHRWTYYAQWRN